MNFQGYMLISASGQPTLLPMDNSSDTTFALMGYVDGKALVHVDYPEAMREFVTGHPTYICERQPELPAAIQALLADPESGISAHAWAGREP